MHRHELISHISYLSINSLTISFSLPEKKILIIKKEMSTDVVYPCPISSPNGKLHRQTVAHPAIWQASLHYRHLQIQLMKCLQTTQDGYETPVYMNSNAQAELQYWLQNLETVNGSAITPPPPRPQIYK